MGMITDFEKVYAVALQMMSSTRVRSKRQQLTSLPDRSRPMTFQDFVAWADTNGVELPLGLPGKPSGLMAGGCFPAPFDWDGASNDPDWKQRTVINDDRVFAELQDLLNASYKKIWTRDRKATGVNRVPAGYKLEKALRNENYNQWCAYNLKKLELDRACRKRGVEQIPVLTQRARRLCERHELKGSCNEWLVFHGTDAAAATSICETGFRMSLSGSNTGSLYGKGVYCAESITKADEYARSDSDGLCCTLVCRLAGGRVLYNDEDAPDVSELQSRMHANSCHTVLGDRTTIKNTFRELVFYEEDQVYVEYVLFYRRVYRDRAGASSTPAAATTEAASTAAEDAARALFGADDAAPAAPGVGATSAAPDADPSAVPAGVFAAASTDDASDAEASTGASEDSTVLPGTPDSDSDSEAASGAMPECHDASAPETSAAASSPAVGASSEDSAVPPATPDSDSDSEAASGVIPECHDASAPETSAAASSPAVGASSEKSAVPPATPDSDSDGKAASGAMPECHAASAPETSAAASSPAVDVPGLDLRSTTGDTTSAEAEAAAEEAVARSLEAPRSTPPVRTLLGVPVASAPAAPTSHMLASKRLAATHP
eukprot:TRINITY_DN2020_c0_g1_i1.p1 TRINITY_DN2020_c0_g1~~TRINITY_DN2020_c0_g1_i1.p1  ORF type:complete len:665 (+),score=173.04 TRINITY_DN2020_c0_g1_i1:183-1997(+)